MSGDAGLSEIVAAVHDDIASEIGSGRVAAYIPALARVDPRKFALAVTTLDGVTTSTGDDETPFSIQSISKVFTLTLVLGRVGEKLWERVGREPSGSAFNSIVQLEQEKGHPRNPLINPGAIVVTDELLQGRRPAVVFTELGDFMRRLSTDERVTMDEDVAASEAEMGFRNVSLANYLKAFGNLRNRIDDVLDVYFHQCALSMTVRQLSRAGLYLANGGTDPLSAESVIDPARARRINAIMMTCGHYDASGDFAFRVGLPGKSGVGGGILVIAPRRAAIAVWSPGLNDNGNSLVGTLALERLAQRTGWSVF